jgi:hypothetical protein
MKETFMLKYKIEGQWLWRKIKNVTGTALIQGAVWEIFLEDKSIRYLPYTTEIYFPPERFYIIKEKMSQEIGQPVPVK